MNYTLPQSWPGARQAYEDLIASEQTITPAFYDYPARMRELHLQWGFNTEAPVWWQSNMFTIVVMHELYRSLDDR